MVFCAKKTNLEFYDEMPTHVLAEYKDIGDSIVLSGLMCGHCIYMFEDLLV